MNREVNIPLAIIDDDIIQTLTDISSNDSKKLNVFREKIVECCRNEKMMFYIFRILKEIELELNDCLNGLMHVNIDKTVVVKILRLIRIELAIIKVKMKREFSIPSAPKPIGKWTDDKLSLIELIYAIYKSKSVNNGKVTLKYIQECFEHLFQIKLGNISNRINEIDNKKEQDKLYLGILITNLNNFLEEANA